MMFANLYLWVHYTWWAHFTDEPANLGMVVPSSLMCSAQKSSLLSKFQKVLDYLGT